MSVDGVDTDEEVDEDVGEDQEVAVAAQTRVR
jgi:hypothetical protein